MEWYYAEGQQKQGPFTDSQMADLIAAGTVTSATLVWNKSFTQWTAAGSTGLFSAQPAPPSGHERCIVTGKVYPVSQMIHTQHGWVSAEGKDRYYQSIRQGAPIATAAGVPNARREGKRIIIPVEGGRLPMRCVKTNQPVQASDVKNRKLFWCSPWIAFSIILSLLVYLILYLILRKKVVIDIPLSPAGKSIVRKHAWIATAIGFGGVILIGFGIAESDTLAGLIILGFLVIIAVLIYGALKANALRVTKIRDGQAWLAGAGDEYLDSLPQ